MADGGVTLSWEFARWATKEEEEEGEEEEDGWKLPTGNAFLPCQLPDGQTPAFAACIATEWPSISCKSMRLRILAQQVLGTSNSLTRKFFQVKLFHQWTLEWSYKNPGWCKWMIGTMKEREADAERQDSPPHKWWCFSCQGQPVWTSVPRTPWQLNTLTLRLLDNGRMFRPLSPPLTFPWLSDSLPGLSCLSFRVGTELLTGELVTSGSPAGQHKGLLLPANLDAIHKQYLQLSSDPFMPK